MNEIFRLTGIVSRAVAVPGTSASSSVRPRLADTVVLGMPQLCMNGLSETWLLKELGHRHWFMLANAAGMSVPDFRDKTGEPVYAAFCAISITGGDLGSARENDLLGMTSSLVRLSRTQIGSQHSLTIDGRPIGFVEMVSTFVVRDSGGGNHNVVRVAVDGLPPAPLELQRGGIAAIAAAFRAGRGTRHFGFDCNSNDTVARFEFDPCPNQDFNGAGFLYFTSFVAFVDRAEWMFDRDNALMATTVRRDVFFTGNVDPGESVCVAVIERRATSNGFSHHCCLTRCSDGIVLAYAFTEKQFV